MINQLGYYETRDGRIVKITRIYESQPVAEGFIRHDGSEVWFIWNQDGSAHRLKEQSRDLIKFLYSDQKENEDSWC